jgi:phage repressor protein C with HTH and peptisase S24 domain/DNA-binding XRE family transcriptional regulator
MSFGTTLKALRLKKNLTQQQVADGLRVSKATISDWEKGKTAPEHRRLDAIADFFGVTQGALLDEPASDTKFMIVSEDGGPNYLEDSELATPNLEPILAWEHPDDLPPGEFVMIPRLNVHLSGGNGHTQVEVEVDLVKDNPQAFRAEWITQQQLKPNKLAAMRAKGDSMEPTIHSGDSLLVDTSQTEIVDGRVYALWYDGGERVKRLYRLPGGGLRIKSDNASFDPIELGADYPGHVRVIGRIVHRSGVGGL